MQPTLASRSTAAVTRLRRPQADDRVRGTPRAGQKAAVRWLGRPRKKETAEQQATDEEGIERASLIARWLRIWEIFRMVRVQTIRTTFGTHGQHFPPTAQSFG